MWSCLVFVVQIICFVHKIILIFWSRVLLVTVFWLLLFNELCGFVASYQFIQLVLVMVTLRWLTIMTTMMMVTMMMVQTCIVCLQSCRTWWWTGRWFAGSNILLLIFCLEIFNRNTHPLLMGSFYKQHKQILVFTESYSQLIYQFWYASARAISSHSICLYIPFFLYVSSVLMKPKCISWVCNQASIVWNACNMQSV